MKCEFCAVYEAGYEKFWLARTKSVGTVVIDPASLLANRKVKLRKTDRIDAWKMVRALRAAGAGSGNAAVLSRVRVGDARTVQKSET